MVTRTPAYTSPSRMLRARAVSTRKCTPSSLIDVVVAISTIRARTSFSSLARCMASRSASTVGRRAPRTASSIPPLRMNVPAWRLAPSRARKPSSTYKINSSWVRLHWGPGSAGPDTPDRRGRPASAGSRGGEHIDRGTHRAQHVQSTGQLQQFSRPGSAGSQVPTQRPERQRLPNPATEPHQVHDRARR